MKDNSGSLGCASRTNVGLVQALRTTLDDCIHGAFGGGCWGGESQAMSS